MSQSALKLDNGDLTGVVRKQAKREGLALSRGRREESTHEASKALRGAPLAPNGYSTAITHEEREKDLLLLKV